MSSGKETLGYPGVPVLQSLFVNDADRCQIIGVTAIDPKMDSSAA
jgi:hypothetical protein